MHKVRIEYSESQKWLRLDNYTHEPNSSGFVTISENMDEGLATEFCIFIERMFDRGSIMDSESIKILFNLWAMEKRFLQNLILMQGM